MTCTPRRRLPLVLALITATTAAAVGPAFATADVSVRRLAGGDRYTTAGAIAKATYPSGTQTVVLASGERFPDALSAAYLAGRLNAPLLLTAGAALTKATETQLDELNAEGVTIVGGAAAVSQAVTERLRALGYTVDRVAGPDRYATSRAIATNFPSSFVGTVGDGGRTAIVASGENFPDALAGAPLSVAESFPVILTASASLSSHAAAALDTLDIQQVLLLGGPSAVSSNVEAQIDARNISVIRIAGANRQDTAAQVADFAVDTLAWEADHANLARGDAFADALTGGPHEGAERAPVLLTSSADQLGSVTTQWLRERSATVASIDVLGGRAAITDATANAAKQAATTAS